MTNYYWTSFDSIWKHFDRAINNWDFVLQEPRTKLSHMPAYPHSDVWFDEKLENLWIRFALAGYAKENVRVKAIGNKLRVIATSEKEPDVKFVHHGISSKDVDFTLSIDENFDPAKAEVGFENGMLTLVIPVSRKSECVDLL